MRWVSLPSSPKVIKFSISNVYIFVQPNKNGIILENRLRSKNHPTWKIMKLLEGCQIWPTARIMNENPHMFVFKYIDV